MKIECKFEEFICYFMKSSYSCSIRNQKILEDEELELIWKHSNGKSNKDIDTIFFDYCEITKVPQKLTKLFPNLRVINIFNSNLKDIRREDLKEYAACSELRFGYNKIEFLPADLFADMKNLEIISFCGNNIQIIEPGLLNGLDKLSNVNFIDNPCINRLFNSLIDRVTLLDEIKQEICVKFSLPPYSIFFENINKLKAKREAGVSNDDVMHVIHNDNLKDFTIRVEGEEFKVHKFLLAARSPVILQIIEKNAGIEELNLIDISIETFRVILDFIYTDKLPTDDGIDFVYFVYLFMAADKLKIKKLKDYAGEKFIAEFNGKVAFDIKALVNKYGNEKLNQILIDTLKVISQLKKEIEEKNN